MTKEELIWLAGFIDGEGCITIAREKDKPRKLILKIGNTNEYIIKLIAKWFKGGIAYQEGKNNSKDSWHFQTCNETAAIILRAVYPYLLIKREQAYIGLEYVKLIYNGNEERYKENKITKIILKLKKKLFNQIRILNQTGRRSTVTNLLLGGDE